MKIAITGANGYIGQEVVAQLKQKQGVELKCIDIDTWIYVNHRKMEVVLKSIG